MPMVNFIVVLAIVLAFMWYDIELFLGHALRSGSGPGARRELVERYQSVAIRRIFVLLEGYCRFRMVYENASGADLPSRFLLVANHQSLLDIPVAMALIHSRRLRFVAKRELGAGVPLVSSILRYQGHALINRKGDAKGTMRAIVRFARRCRAEGTCPVIFPEGTRSRDIGVFHTAGVRKILDIDPLPMAAAVIEGGWRVAKLGDIFRNLRGARYRVRIVAIIPAPSGKKETLRSLEAARDLIVEAQARMRAEHGGEGLESA